MKKIIKRTFLIIGLMVLIIIAVIIGAIGIDANNTSYLKVKKNGPFYLNTYLIKNVNVIPMTSDTVLRGKMVLIKNGIIARIEDDISVTQTTIIDGEDAYLIPGLIDMHVHIWDEYELGLYLANGITTVRNLWGLPMHLRMKKSIHDEKIVGPMFFTSGPKLTGPHYPGDDNLQLFTREQARCKIKDYKEKGYDFIKTYNGLTQELFDEVLQESRSQAFDIVAHPSAEVSYQYHFKPEIVSIEHVEDIVQQPLHYQLDTVKLNDVVDLFASSPEASICPTLVVYNNIYRLLTEDNLLNSSTLNDMNPLIRMVDSKAQFNRWAQTKALDSTIVNKIQDQHEFHLLAIKKLHQRGVNIIAGTDAGIGVTPAGSSFHKELNFYIKAGMSNYEALKTATINPTKTHDFLNNVGSIEVGKIANLVLLENNPLNDIGALKRSKFVLVRGRKISRETLNKFEAKAANRNNMLVSALRYAEYLLIER